MKQKLMASFSPLQSWWHSISPRERRLVSIGGGLLVLGALYWGAIQPLMERQQQAQLRLNSEKQLLSWVTKSANSITALRASGGIKGSQFSLPLNQVVSSTVKRFNVSLVRMQPRNDSLQVWIQPLPFNELLTWIAELKEKYGVNVEYLDMNKSDKSGVVEVSRLQLTRS